MIIKACNLILSRLSPAPDRISFGPKFNTDALRFAQSVKAQTPVQYATMNETKIFIDPAVQGHRVRIGKDEKERTFNFKSFQTEGPVKF